MLFNESSQALLTTIEIAVLGDSTWINTTSGEVVPADRPIRLQLDSHEMKILRVIARGSTRLADNYA